MNSEWTLYIAFAPLSLGAIAYFTWLITGIIDSAREDSHRKKGIQNRKHDESNLSSCAPYIIIFFTNLYSVETMHSHQYADMVPTSQYGWFGIAILFAIDILIIRFISYSFTRDDITVSLKAIFGSRYTLFTIGLICLDLYFAYSYHEGTDELWNIVYECIVWAAVVAIAVIVGIASNRNTHPGENTPKDKDHYRSPAIVWVILIAIFVIEWIIDWIIA